MNGAIFNSYVSLPAANDPIDNGINGASGTMATRLPLLTSTSLVLQDTLLSRLQPETAVASTVCPTWESRPMEVSRPMELSKKSWG